MVMATAALAPLQHLAALHPEPIGKGLHLQSQFAQLHSRCMNSIRFFHPQFRGIGHQGLSLGLTAQQGHQGQLIDDPRNEIASDLTSL